jgi:hypothetical protein
MQNFCAPERQKSPDDQTNGNNRLTMIQPYLTGYAKRRSAIWWPFIRMTSTEASWTIRWDRQAAISVAGQHFEGHKRGGEWKSGIPGFALSPVFGRCGFCATRQGTWVRRNAPSPGWNTASAGKYFAAGFSRKRAVPRRCFVSSRICISGSPTTTRPDGNSLPGVWERRSWSGREDLHDVLEGKNRAPRCPLRCDSTGVHGYPEWRLGEGRLPPPTTTRISDSCD